MLEKKIKLPKMDTKQVNEEIGDFVVNKVVNMGKTGCVVGLSGGVDSTVTAAIIKDAFDRYNETNPKDPIELVGYLLPSKVNDPADTSDGEQIAKQLGIRYEMHSIEGIVEAYESTNPEIFETGSKLKNDFHKGNMMSRIRANILSTKAAFENKLVAGTGNKDEDFGIGYYTLFGDGAVHLSPIGSLSKRLVKQMARYHGFLEIAVREPTAGLELGQTDFKDLGYSYDTVEIITEGLSQNCSQKELVTNKQVVSVLQRDIKRYESCYGEKKFENKKELVDDILYKHKVAFAKAQLIHPPIAKVTLKY